MGCIADMGDGPCECDACMAEYWAEADAIGNYEEDMMRQLEREYLEAVEEEWLSLARVEDDGHPD